MPKNTGRCPPEAKGKRVIVQLRNGTICGEAPVGNALPSGWDAKTTRWTLTGDPHDVIHYKVIV